MIKKMTFTLRLDPCLLERLKYIAQTEFRSTTGMIEVICKEHVAQFEKEYGEITRETP